MTREERRRAIVQAAAGLDGAIREELDARDAALEAKDRRIAELEARVAQLEVLGAVRDTLRCPECRGVARHKLSCGRG